MKIVIPGKPIAQGRPRLSKRGRFVSVYDPNSKEKKHIREQLESYKKPISFEYPRISFIFHLPIPKSIPKRELEVYNSGKLKHVKKPDIDNLIKLYLDCLDGIIIHADQKVSLGPCVKVYHPEPKVLIWIHETTKMLTHRESDLAFPDVLEFDEQNHVETACPLGLNNPIWSFG